MMDWVIEFSVRQNLWCGLRRSVFYRARPIWDQKIGLGLEGLVLYCEVKHDLFTLVVIMILKDTTSFRVLFAVAAPATWNSLSDELRSGSPHSATFRRNLKPPGALSASEALCDYTLYKSTFTLHHMTLHYIICIVSVFCAWNLTTVEINSGVHLL